MKDDHQPSASPTVTASSGRADDGPPDLRILHYNDVYHLDPSSAEPAGGLARFITVLDEYRSGERYRGQPDCLTLFSGDAFNPSLESTVTKGAHMVPVLNAIGTDCACVGNHDFDFGVEQYKALTARCNFPWLIANVLDPNLGEDVPLGNARRTAMLTTSNGVKVGLVGLGEREWLATINSLPPNLIYRSASETAKELVPKLREDGAEIVICLSHMREPNDNKLADKTDGLFDIILGGHDHYYAHSLIKGTHVLRSGTDFKQLSYVEARRRRAGIEADGRQRWDFDIVRRDVVSSLAEDAATLELVRSLTSKLHQKLSQSIGWTAAPLDARFKTVRLRESNLGNFVCDIMRSYHGADCAIMAAGTIRGDQIYPPGALRVRDLTNCFPFEDPVVLLRPTGRQIREALENGVSLYPALEGRFPQVSNIEFTFDPKRKAGARLVHVRVAGQELDEDKKYKLATRGYMGRGKDGYDPLLVESEGGTVEEIVCEENGILISTMLRQYFMGLRTLGQWKNLSSCWVDMAKKCPSPVLEQKPWPPQASARKNGHLAAEPAVPMPSRGDDDAAQAQTQKKKSNGDVGVSHGQAASNGSAKDEEPGSWQEWLQRRVGFEVPPMDDDASDSDEAVAQEGSSGDKGPGQAGGGGGFDDRLDIEVLLMRKFFGRWARRAGVASRACDVLDEAECTVDWTRVIAPALDGRIKMVE